MNEIYTASIILGVWNIIVFGLYGMDKHKAKYGRHRINEKTLLIMTALMGGLGAFFGMYVFRHKTKHIKFKIGVPILLITNIAVIIIIIKLMAHY